MPEAQPLAALRRDVDRKPHKLKQVLMDANVRKEFLGGVAADEKKVVRAFVGLNKESALKTKPKGYDADHRDIDLLRLKSFTMLRKLEESEVTSPRGLDRIAELVGHLVPFVSNSSSKSGTPLSGHRIRAPIVPMSASGQMLPLSASGTVWCSWPRPAMYHLACLVQLVRAWMRWHCREERSSKRGPRSSHAAHSIWPFPTRPLQEQARCSGRLLHGRRVVDSRC
ncbi:hypothetical protein K402DRAFT_128506 [Aulographum hederae CBS 113979]|uniref:Uncharacterized protein n=1 Tax=Aulographum hederae CBS 113979 TaxID=1176131 RepID=A0A6G1HES4_9PEZI|nr:hypothetical protein K402DRAFT_128506 [Aulographum hederae CBS 113979]